MGYRVYTMSHTLGIRELRQQASALLRRVADGESIDITDHGHPVARLVPLRPSELDQMVLDGRAVAARVDLADLADELGLPVPLDVGLAPSEALAVMRADER